MADRITIEQRHANMAAIKGKNTKPEIIVRKFLWAHGFRYRLNHPRLPGKPDIVLRRYKTCVFVNGCFWHGHLLNLAFDNLQDAIYADATRDIQNSECCKIPQTNREFWVRKIVRNKERDESVQRELADMGWHCITIWECELKTAERREETLSSLLYTLNHIFLNDHSVHKPMTYALPEDDDFAMAAEEISRD